MTSSRDDLLGAVRTALGRDGPVSETVGRALEARLAAAKPGTIPARGQLGRREQFRLFVQMAREAAASVEEVRTLRAVPGAVAGFLASHNLAARVVVAPDPALEGVNWGTRKTLTVRSGRARPADQASVTGAFAGIAETGTLMLLSGPAGPTTLNFLPDNHIVILRAEHIVGDYEAAWKRLRADAAARQDDQAMPRSVNLITGPSRSADIEQTLLMGAHGPRRLHIVIVKG